MPMFNVEIRPIPLEPDYEHEFMCEINGWKFEETDVEPPVVMVIHADTARKAEVIAAKRFKTSGHYRKGEYKWPIAI